MLRGTEIILYIGSWTDVLAFPIIASNFVYLPLMIALIQEGTKYIKRCLKTDDEDDHDVDDDFDVDVFLRQPP